MAFASCTTMDDLVTSTGLARKNLHDNIASARKENLCQRINDDVTGQPAYKRFGLRSLRPGEPGHDFSGGSMNLENCTGYPEMPKDSSECVKLLRQFNEWRRFDGEIDEEGPAMPHPRAIGFAIDMAIQLIEERGELLAAVEQTLDENGHLADGENCTLIVLKKALVKVKGGV